MHKNLIDLTGKVYGRLTVLARGKNKGVKPGWICLCECGKVCHVRGSDLTMGKQKSCGCLQKDAATKHGNTGSGGWRTTEYNTWQAMKDRCYNPKNPRYYCYGGRGIGVCREWRDSFEQFLADMGRKPSPKHSIERIDNDRNYSPDNCCWATDQQQAENKRWGVWMTHNGQTKLRAAWARETGIPESTIKERMNRGWSVEKTLTTPPKKQKGKNY